MPAGCSRSNLPRAALFPRDGMKEQVCSRKEGCDMRRTDKRIGWACPWGGFRVLRLRAGDTFKPSRGSVLNLERFSSDMVANNISHCYCCQKEISLKHKANEKL